LNNFKGRYWFGHLSTDGRLILRWMEDKCGVEMWIHLLQERVY
jgi:hypothetical protein